LQIISLYSHPLFMVQMFSIIPVFIILLEWLFSSLAGQYYSSFWIAQENLSANL